MDIQVFFMSTSRGWLLAIIELVWSFTPQLLRSIVLMRFHSVYLDWPNNMLLQLIEPLPK